MAGHKRSTNTSGLCICLVAGGTGGHVFPAQAVARQLQARGHSPFWVGRPDSLESRTAAACDCQFFAIRVSGLRGRAMHHRLRALWQSGWQTVRLVRLFGRLRPRAIMTFGGYTSVPAGLAARICGIPLLIHEQNSHSGSANRLLARWAGCVCCAFPQAFADHPHRQQVGNPVRHVLTPHYSSDTRPLRLLVLGGSQGAASLNAALVQLFALGGLERPLHLVHQCGNAGLATTQSDYAQLMSQTPNMRQLLKLRVQAFLGRIDWYYSWCDLLVCRAGAITLAEVCLAGKPALLVPFPYATDDHQFHNASSLVRTGGAEVLRDTDRLAGQLHQLLLSRLNTPVARLRPGLHQRGRKLTQLARADAAERIADLIEEQAG